MTKTSKVWRVKKQKRIRVINKIHNSFLAIITGIMSVFFLLSLCAMDNINKNVLLMFTVSTTWLILFTYANELDHIKEGDE